MPMQLRVDGPPEEVGDLSTDVMEELQAQIRKKRVALRVVENTGNSASKGLLRDWANLDWGSVRLVSLIQFFKLEARSLINPLTEDSALSLSEVASMGSKDDLLEAIITHYQDEARNTQIETMEALVDRMKMVFRNCKKVIVFDRYLLRNTAAVASGNHKQLGTPEKEKFGVLLRAAQEVASERGSGSNIEFVIRTVLVNYYEWCRYEKKDSGHSVDAYREWFQGSEQKRRDFAEWAVGREEDYPNLTVVIEDMSNGGRQDTSDHDRFIHVEHTETLVSTAGFAMKHNERDDKIHPKTYIIRVEKPGSWGGSRTKVYP